MINNPALRFWILLVPDTVLVASIVYLLTIGLTDGTGSSFRLDLFLGVIGLTGIVLGSLVWTLYTKSFLPAWLMLRLAGAALGMFIFLLVLCVTGR